MADQEVDAVVITVPATAHAELIVAAAEAGKAIFCEKPVDATLERAALAVQAVDRAKVLHFIAFMKRFDRDFRIVIEGANQGKVGQVELVLVTNRDPKVTILEYLRATHDMAPYALLRESTVHDFDLQRALLPDEPVEVFVAASSLIDPEISALGEIDTAVVTLRCKSGALGHINNSWRAVYGYDQRVEVFGSLGMLRAENRSEANVNLYTAAGVQQPRLWSGPPGSSDFFMYKYREAYSAEIDYFIESVAREEMPTPNLHDGLKAQCLVDAAVESYRTHKPALVWQPLRRRHHRGSSSSGDP